MKIGIILIGYNMEEYVQPCLRAWTDARGMRLGGHEFIICAVSLPFLGFPDAKEDGTRSMLCDLEGMGYIDNVIESPRNIPETVARGMALSWLKDRGITHTIQVDLDEFYTEADILNIFSFVEVNPFIVAYRLSLKNLVFDEHTYLAEPFMPMRIHRIDSLSSCIATSFWDDNNVLYEGAITGAKVKDIEMANMTIPPSVAFVRHASWLSNDRSRRKVEYQLARGWTPSFLWDDSKGLIFNPALPAPKILSDSP